MSCSTFFAPSQSTTSGVDSIGTRTCQTVERAPVEKLFTVDPHEKKKMPCTLPLEAFECVRTFIWSRPEGVLTGRASDNPLGALYMTPQNLRYIFCEYVKRFEHETGWVIDADSHRLDAFSALMYDAYVTGMCRYMPTRDATRVERAKLVQQWNEDTIKSIVFEALKEARKKVNYLRRARDPLYGRRTWNPVHVAKPSVSRIENSYRFAYTQLGANKYPYTMSVPDDG